MTRRNLILVGLAVSLIAVAGLVIQKELLLRDGTSMFLPLAPVDPRSLIEGDYMRLRYKISEDVARDQTSIPPDGYLVVVTDQDGIASFRRVHGPATALAPDEKLLRYRFRDYRARLGAEAFYFEEGRAEFFAKAAFGELKVTPSGQSLLVGLRDKDLNPLK